MTTLLEAKEVTKTYEKAQRPSLNKISFRVEPGEFIGIMGASGSGKTTLLNVLSTIDTPTSGDIWINGVNLKKLNSALAILHCCVYNLLIDYKEIMGPNIYFVNRIRDIYISTFGNV